MYYFFSVYEHIAHKRRWQGKRIAFGYFLMDEKLVLHYDIYDATRQMSWWYFFTQTEEMKGRNTTQKECCYKAPVAIGQ